MAVKCIRMDSCASDGTTGWDQGLRQNKQSIHQTKKAGTDVPPKKPRGWHGGRPSKGGMDLLGSVWNGYGKVLLVVEEKGVLRPQCSPKHNAFDSSLCGCDLTTSISSPRTSHGNICESAQTDDLPRQPSKKYSTEADVSHHVRHVLEDSSGDGYRRPRTEDRRPGEWVLSPKKSPKKPINGMCLGEESTDDSTQSGNSQASAPQAKDRWDLQGRPRWGIQHETGCECPVHLTRL